MTKAQISLDAPSMLHYFFLTGTVTGAVFGAVAQDTPAAGDAGFFGCLGFFTSRLLRS
ncbi:MULTISPECIES: hypothetical protein [Paraburkholderia]|uniref:hypothetical protein n=1 Tax=Paraburkholderia TaxID=1822464 RepID=UPI0014791098|nr:MULTISPECIES: hypothetical protein [Paraburkholderia]MCX4164153.1 hypothetical protein [Paraburkholderia megapolitana]MDN7159647.1 hypothetical protein [Paraburkholderia sp. CHISQ3]MDQ6496694.1 hypothetical protein [Paraburkholderia megapolitana]